MAYTIRIERTTGPAITLAEWKGAVDAHPLVRLAPPSAIASRNPHTDERIGMVAAEGDAEIWLEARKSWVHALRWRKQGCIEVNATQDFDAPTSFLRNLLRPLAAALNAGILGEEDEEYS